MPRALVGIVSLAVLLIASSGTQATAAPLFTLGEDGHTFVYRARPGDHPGVVAEMFGISSKDLDAFLKANHITDPTKIEPGFEYHIKNPVAARAEQLEAENARLAKAADEAEKHAKTLAREGSEARAAATAAEEQASHLAGVETRWSIAKVVLVLLALAAAGAGALASAAVRRQAQAEHYASGLALQLEDKQRHALAERQESGRHIIELESRIRSLEAQLGPRVVIGGRSS